MINLAQTPAPSTRPPPLPGTDCWRLLYVVVQRREPWTAPKLAQCLLMQLSSVRTYVNRLRAQGLLAPAIPNGEGYGKISATPEGVTYIEGLKVGKRLVPLSRLDAVETPKTRDFQMRTAALMVRLENTNRYRSRSYKWLAEVHQHTAAGVWPSAGAWKELERLEGLSKPEAPCV